jgi:dihydropyrimidinase
MADYDLVVHNCTVATASDIFRADIGIQHGRIASLSARLANGNMEIDAKGDVVTPGGVDSHCHIEQRSSTGIMTADDFFTATRSAACGGTTTVIPFAAQYRGMTLEEVLKDYHTRANPKACVDYAFHLIIADPRPCVLNDELPGLMERGYTSVKIYMTYDSLRLDDRQILDVMAATRGNGLVMVHAENHDAIGWLSDKLLAAGHSAPRFHSLAHVRTAEREATHRVISLAELLDVPILIVHVSSREAVEQIHWAQERGLKVYGETCPQYLFLTEDDMDRPGFEGAKFMCSPPPRDQANQEVIWDALRSYVLDVFSSDHAGYRYSGLSGKSRNGQNAPFREIPNGVPGLEVRMALLFSEGVGKERIDLQGFVALTATNPAKLYGLYPRKGSLGVGADADFVIWDSDKVVTISQTMMHDAMDYTPYEGMTIRGWPRATFLRGEIVAQEGQFRGAPGKGQFLTCGSSKEVKPLGRQITAFDPASGRLHEKSRSLTAAHSRNTK